MFTIYLDQFIFEDEDDEPSALSYTVYVEYCINSTNKKIRRQLKSQDSRFWLLFDEKRFQIKGTPQIKDIEYNSTTKAYYQQYKITIHCSDKIDTAKQSFYLTLYNHIPEIVGPSLQQQFDQKYGEI